MLMGQAGRLSTALFDAIDEDGSGFLEEQEGRQYLLLSGCDESEVDYYWTDLLRTADTNRDGKISKTEFLVYTLGDEELEKDGSFADKEHEAQLRARLSHVRGAVDSAMDVADARCSVVSVVGDGLSRRTADSILRAIDVQLLDTSIVSSGLRSLWQLALDNSDVSQHLIGAGLVTVVKVMNAHPSIAAIQESGCGVIWVASHNSTLPEQAGRIFKLAVTTVRTAVRRFPRELGIQEAGCAVLGNLALYTSLRSSLQSDKNLVLQAMQTHASDPNISATCLKALFNLNLRQQ